MPTSPSLSETADKSFLVPVIVTTSYLTIGLLAWAVLVAMRLPYTWMFGELDYKDRRTLGRQEKLAHSIESAQLRLDVEHAIRRCRTVARLRYRVSTNTTPSTVIIQNLPFHSILTIANHTNS